MEKVMCVFPSEYAKSCTDRWWGPDLTMLASTMLHPRSTKVCAQILTALVKGYSAVHPDCCSAAIGGQRFTTAQLSIIDYAAQCLIPTFDVNFWTTADCLDVVLLSA